MYVWDPRARRLPSIRRFILLSSQPPSRGGIATHPHSPFSRPPVPELVSPRTIHMYVRLWVSKGGFCTMKWETWEANQQTYPSRRSLPSLPLRSYSLADRMDPHSAIAEELLAKTEYSSVSKELTLKPEIRDQMLARLISMKYTYFVTYLIFWKLGLDIWETIANVLRFIWNVYT